MIKIKKIIFFIIKSTLTIVIFLTLILFLYAAFFYEPSHVERKTTKDQTTKSEEPSGIKKEEEQSLRESQLEEKIRKTEVKQTEKAAQNKTKISDSLFMTVGNRPVLHSDVINEMKVILILNDQSYSVEKKQRLQEMAVKSLIKRNVKQIALDKNNYFQFNNKDFQKELIRLASLINVDLETLKNICKSNDLDFTLIENQIKTELFWNSLIFQLYKNKVSVNPDEIEEKLKQIKDSKNIEEYLISEILVKIVEKNKLEDEIKELKNKIKIGGFESVARSLSISTSSTRGGDLGWVNENIISAKVKSIIAATPIGNLSQPLLLPEGILIFKIRDKRKVKDNINLEEAKDQLVNSEKTKILQTYALSHYDKLRRSVSIKFFDD